MKYKIDVIYNSLNAKECKAAEDFIEMLGEYIEERNDLDISVKNIDISEADEDEVDEMEEKYDEIKGPIIAVNNIPLFESDEGDDDDDSKKFPTEYEFKEAFDSFVEESEFA